MILVMYQSSILFFGIVFCMFLDMFIFCVFFFFKQKTEYEWRIRDWSSDVCSSDLVQPTGRGDAHLGEAAAFEEQRHRCRVEVVEMLVVDGAGCVAERDRVESVDVGAGEQHPAARPHQPTAALQESGGVEQMFDDLDRKSTRPNSSH